MASGLGAMLLTRVAVKAAALDAFDHWQRAKHLVELSGVVGVAAVSYYAAQSVIPGAVSRPANRMAAYWAHDAQDLGRFLDDPTLAAAVKDGSRFFDDFEELDGAVYTGNVYELVSFTDLPDTSALHTSLLVERYQVNDDDVGTFEAWLLDEHLPAVAALDPVSRVAWGRGIQLPTAIPYYRSPGNRLILAEYAAGTNAGALALAVAGLPAWDGISSYVRQEVNEPLAVEAPIGQGVDTWQM